MDKTQGNAGNLASHEASRYRAAALHARRAPGGPIGELVRELTAYAEFGHRFIDDGLIPRLAAEILATPSAPDHHPQAPDRWSRVEGIPADWWIRETTRPRTDHADRSDRGGLR